MEYKNRKQMLRRKNKIYLMQRVCESDVQMELKKWFVSMVILGNTDINQKPLYSQIHLPHKWLLFESLHARTVP